MDYRELNAKLLRYKLDKEVESTGQELGSCAYGKAMQLRYRGMKCTGTCYQAALDDATELTERFAKHCALLSDLRHPNIVQFLGLYASSKQCPLPMIVTECLPTSLAKVLEKYGSLPDELEYSILRDVSLALSYLHSHSPPVYHGDLSASNVLLGWDLSAKITEMGVADMLKLSAERRTKQLGENSLKMINQPPEVLDNPAVLKLTRKTDAYAFGVLMLHTLTSEIPEHLASPSLHSKFLLGDLTPTHPLATLLLQCLSRVADLRPDSSRILETFSAMMMQYPPASFERRVDLLQQVKMLGGRGTIDNFPTQLVRKDSIATMANSLEIEHLKLQIGELHVENRGLQTALQKQQGLVGARDQEMAAKLMAKDQEILSKSQELSAQQAAVESCEATIAAKEATVQGLSNQLRHMQSYLATKHEVGFSLFF